MGDAIQLKASATYRPRRPEETVLYQAVAANYRTFEALAELEEKRLPQHVTKEFEAFLRCGILAYGFLRLQCEDCGSEKLLAFSCKKRGFCSSCGGRRMVESAAHLVEEVFPRQGVRQWVLSFPMPVRWVLAQNRSMQAHCLTIVHRAITAYLRKKAKRQTPTGANGCISLFRFFGCLAPHAKIRSQIVPQPSPAHTPDGAVPENAPRPSTRPKRWAELLARVFGIDLMSCPDCGGCFKIIAAILEPHAIGAILTHLRLPDKPPAIARAQLPDQLLFA